jgi:hypothetical protein
LMISHVCAAESPGEANPRISKVLAINQTEAPKKKDPVCWDVHEASLGDPAVG